MVYSSISEMGSHYCQTSIQFKFSFFLSTQEYLINVLQEYLINVLRSNAFLLPENHWVVNLIQEMCPVWLLGCCMDFSQLKKIEKVLGQISQWSYIQLISCIFNVRGKFSSFYTFLENNCKIENFGLLAKLYKILSQSF